MSETYDNVGDEECPLEPVPPQLWACSTALLAKPTAGDAVIIIIALTRHPGFIASESLSSTTLLWYHVIYILSMFLAVDEWV